jgi:hypothetical protein
MRLCHRTILPAVVLLAVAILCPVYGAEVRLQWDRPVSGAPPAGFRVYWDTRPDGERFRYDAGNKTSCTIPGLDEGCTYYIVARSYTSAGVESVCSNQVTYKVPEIDSDEDGIPDHEEIAVYGTFSRNPDTDMDGIADGAEAAYWGERWQGDEDGDGLSNLLDPDSDDDGWLDGEELLAGTDLADSSVFPDLPSVWIEAEAGTLNRPMEAAEDGSCSGGAYVWVLPGPAIVYNPWQTAGEAVCVFRVEQEGDYVLWGRVLAPDQSQNGVYVSVDGSGYAFWNVSVQEAWEWQAVRNKGGANPVVYHLKPGEHVLVLKQREAGVKVDVLVARGEKARGGKAR